MTHSTAQSNLLLWSFSGADPVRREVTGPVSLSAEEVPSSESSMSAQGPVLAPLEASDGVDGAIAVLVLSRQEVAPAVAVNGVRTRAGMHLLRHGDRVSAASGEVWVAVACTPSHVQYDPALHGEDQFCFRTKVRFEPGAQLVICPGTVQAACGMLYSAAAWETELPCLNCGWKPNTPEWQPPPPKTESSVTRLLERARERVAQLALGAGEGLQ